MDNQLFQDSDVIAYKPSLAYQKDVRTENPSAPEEEPLKITEALASFLQNKPSAALMTLMTTLEGAETILSYLGKTLQADIHSGLSFESYRNGLAVEDRSAVLPYLESHRSDIEGKTAVEAYHAVYGAVAELRELKRIHSLLFYGDENVAKEKAVVTDQAYELRLLGHEEKGEEMKVNHLALSTDAVLSRTIASYGQVLSGYVRGMASLVTDSTFYPPVTKTAPVDTTLVGLFQNVSEKNRIDQENLDRQASQQLLPRTIHELVGKRNEVNRMLAAKDTLDYASLQRSGILNKAVSVAREELLEAMVELTKASISQTMQHDQYLKSLEEKDYYRKIYDSLV